MSHDLLCSNKLCLNIPRLIEQLARDEEVVLGHLLRDAKFGHISLSANFMHVIVNWSRSRDFSSHQIYDMKFWVVKFAHGIHARCVWLKFDSHYESSNL